MLSSTRLDLLRHGEPVGGRRFRGSTDDPLSEVGWQQMRAAVQGYLGWQTIITSPLSRCRAFADELAGQQHIEVIVDPRLAEMQFGAWEGLTPDQVEQDYSEALKRFYHNPFACSPPGGESMQAFTERVSNAWSELLQQFSGQQLLVITHGGVIRVILQQVLGFPLENMFRIQMGFAAMANVIVDDDGEQHWPRIKKISEGY